MNIRDPRYGPLWTVLRKPTKEVRQELRSCIDDSASQDVVYYLQDAVTMETQQVRNIVLDQMIEERDALPS